MKEKFKIEGIVHIFDFSAREEAEVRSRMQRGETLSEISKGIPCVEYTRHNMVLNKGIKDIAKSFVSTTKLDTIKYISISKAGGVVSPEDTVLTEETVRLPITNVYLEEQTGISVIAETFIGTQEANFNWLELGLIKGGTEALNTGTLFSKVAVNIQKTNQSAKTIMWEIIFKSGEEI